MFLLRKNRLKKREKGALWLLRLKRYAYAQWASHLKATEAKDLFSGDTRQVC